MRVKKSQINTNKHKYERRITMSKESKKVLKSFEDLEKGMKVYIRNDLKTAVYYGGNSWFSSMATGVVEFDDFEPEDRVSKGSGYKHKDTYRYTNEMIDWDKTNEINGFGIKSKSQSEQRNFITLPQIKVVNSEEDSEHFFGTFIQVDERTVIYTENNTVGVAYCHPDDEFSLETGKALAFYRWTKGE